jgi:hypothetical protein
VEARLAELQKYREACLVLKAGPPTQLINLKLPDISTWVEPVTETRAPEFRAGTDNERYRQLAELAGPRSLTAEGVLIISLYECLKTDTQNRKAVIALLKTADDVGLLEKFGLPKPKEVYDIWQTPDKIEERFLDYGGGFAGGMYSRTSRPLEWSVELVLTVGEIENFVDAVVQSVTARKLKPIKKRRRK